MLLYIILHITDVTYIRTGTHLFREIYDTGSLSVCDFAYDTETGAAAYYNYDHVKQQKKKKGQKSGIKIYLWLTPGYGNPSHTNCTNSVPR